MGTDSGTLVDASIGGKLDKENSWVWKDKGSAVFTVKSTYKVQ